MVASVPHRSFTNTPMTKAFDKVRAGLEDAHAYLKGLRDGFEVHEVEVPGPDAAAIPRQEGMVATRPGND